MKGTQVVGTTNTSFGDANKEVFGMIDRSDSVTITKEELAFYINELLKSQVKELQNRIEYEVYSKNEHLTAAQKKYHQDGTAMHEEASTDKEFDE